ncbi:MAG: STAS domain-containing protein [Pirellulaceae bacterium]
MFDIQHQGDVVVVVPQYDLREFEFGQIELEGAEVLEILEQSRAKHAVFDFHKTDYYGSTALSFFVKVWKRVRANGGSMAFCNVSVHELEILELTKLNELWSLCNSRDEALDEVR